MSNYKFEGWLGKDEKAHEGNMVWGEYEPKKWEETDVDIEISHAGICGSDIHTLSSGWGETPYPVVVGHEIIGKAVRVGSQVKGIQVGDRVGVGAQAESCLNRDPKKKCVPCDSKAENYCTTGRVDTFASNFYNGDKTYGGYAKYNRTPGHFVFKIPEALPSSTAAPMLCGGITLYSPLKHFGAGPKKSVGIVGVGGLGHFGLLFAKALGSKEVVAISRRKNKAEDALKLGADRYIATAEDKDWATENKGTLDLIISTVSSNKMPLDDYLGLLRPDGILCQVGAPEENIHLNIFSLIPGRLSLTASAIGSPDEIREMLQLAAEQKIKAWIEERPMTEANQAVVDFRAGKPRYRYVLVN